MIRIPCPYCNLRNASEFRYVGEAGARPNPDRVTPAQWRRYLYEAANPAGWTAELWYHTMGCRRFLRVERHTGTGEIRSASPAGRHLESSPDAVPAVADSGAPDAGGHP